jgi:hypothetical protein
MLWVERVGDRRSQAILAQDFSAKNRARAQSEKKTPSEGEVVRSFYFCFSSLAEPRLQRPGAVKGAPLFGRGGSAPLTARSAAKESVREEKNSFSTVHDVYHNGGQS